MKRRKSSPRRRTGINQFWLKWMVLSSWIIIASGMAMVLLPDVMNGFFSQLFFFIPDRFTGFGAEAEAYVTFTHGVVGAVMAGWGVSLMAVLYGPFRNGNRDGWIAIASSVTVWFILDTTLSLVHGFWQNALLNLAILQLYAIPLAATRRSFFGKNI